MPKAAGGAGGGGAKKEVAPKKAGGGEAAARKLGPLTLKDAFVVDSRMLSYFVVRLLLVILVHWLVSVG